MNGDLDVVRLAIAALGGAAVGLERQWSGHAVGPAARFGGIRTFTLLGGLGGVSGALWQAGLAGLSVVLLAGAVALVAAAYAAGSRRDIDATTEVAALVVLAAGVVSGTGAVRLASGIFALTCLLLVEKTRLHSFVGRIDAVALGAGVRFAVMALVILPLLPAGPFGPFGGVRPRELWALVLFFSAVSFLGFIARGLVGPGQGYLATGLLGGLISSTNVTFTFSRLSRSQAGTARDLAFGVVGANTVLYPRVLAVTAALNPALVLPLAPYLAVPGLAAAAVLALGVRRPPREPQDGRPAANPLQLGAALQMAVVFQVVLFAVHAAREAYGTSGVLTSAAVLGLTDVDALTMSMARGVAQAEPLPLAALAIAVGILSNTLLKLGVVLVLGSGPFRLIAGGALALMAAAGLAAVLLL